MRDWLHSTPKEINTMSFDEAVEIIERQIELGHSKGDYKPRPHMTKALEIILQAAKTHDDDCIDFGTLADWYINSVSSDDTPVWTEEHIEELLNDFYVIPKDQ